MIEVNYRIEPVGEQRWLQISTLATPVLPVPPDARLRLCLLFATNRVCNHSFTVNDH
jgi:hypothetical protein